ncbi:sulfurtransferase TusA family protein [Sporosarcina pasteurii]|uniref:Sulfurtransferase TusA n=1 Tax=Sporosarcina pasteurii TaxID=1474 RepID=A0A380BBT5_SPOPA|nr:Sulfurtransferase TusA [Sporosarcina pasteurii]
MIHSDYQIDAKGLACPMPIVKTRKALNDVTPGSVVEVAATDKGSTADLKAWAKSAGHEYIGTVEEGGVLRHYLRKANEAEEKEERFPHVVSNEQLASLLESEQNIVLLDVREEAEYAFGHIPSAKSMPLNTVDEQMNQVDQSSDVYVICRTGNRSDLVAKKLTEAGFSNVYNVVPGMSEWNGTIEKNE